MKWSLISLLTCLAILVGIALWKGDGAMETALKTSGAQSLKFLPVLLVAFLIMGFADTLLPKEFVQKWLSDSAGWRGIGIGWLAGALTPAGSLVGLPLAASLMKAGVGIGVLVTYLTSLALLSIIRFPIEVGFIGVKLALVRIAASFFLPPIAGLTTMYIQRWLTR